VVSNDEEIEKSLADNVKSADAVHRARECSILRLQQRLLEAKRVHTAKLREEAVTFNMRETKIDQSILRERAELTKVANI